VRLALQDDRAISVEELALGDHSEADGLAVAQASEFAAPRIRPLVSGIFTVPDELLFEDLYVLDLTEGIHIEPSAAAGFRGPQWLLDSPNGQAYLAHHDLRPLMDHSTHILWTTGGAFVPESEYRQFRAQGQELARLARPQA
jgi:D-serine dehydratase